MAAVILRVAGADSASSTAVTTAAHSGVRSRPGPRRRRTWSPPHCPILEHRARAVIVGGIGAGPGLDPDGQRGQVAQVPADRRGGDQDRIGSVPAVPGAGRSGRRWCGRGTRAGLRRPALRRPGVSAGQSAPGCTSRGAAGRPWSEPGSAWPRPCWSLPSDWRSSAKSTSAASPAACCPAMPQPPCSTRLFTSSSEGSGSCWRSGWSSPSGRSSPDPVPHGSPGPFGVQVGDRLDPAYGERKGVSTGPVCLWTYVHRRSLRVGAVALAALIFAFWAQPTAP